MADDLLKNDGQKFLEMMEQLAERRMMREEEAVASIEDDSDDDDEDEDDEDDDADDDDDDEEDEDDEEDVCLCVAFGLEHAGLLINWHSAHHDGRTEDARGKENVLYLRCAHV